MTNTLVNTDGAVRLLMRSPAVRKGSWLPLGLFEELDPVARDHREAVTALDQALTEASALGRSFKAEDEKRVEAYGSGLDVPEMTDPGERQRLVLDARAKVEGAQKSLEAAVIAAVKLVQANEAKWFDRLRERDQKAAAKREEAARLLAEAEAELVGVERTAHWVRRTALNRDSAHIGHDALPVRQPEAAPRLSGLHGSAVAVA